MPELPEVEVLVRHLAPLVHGRCIRGVEVRRAKVVEPTPVGRLKRMLIGARFAGLERRGKYLVFRLTPSKRSTGTRTPLEHHPSLTEGRVSESAIANRQLLPPTSGHFILVGHLGMTGRIFVAPRGMPLPKHTAVALDLGRHQLVFEDTRYFGRLTLDTTPLTRLGPEPLGEEFTADCFGGALRRSAQAIKVRLLDQSLVAGVGNIYASEALFRAGISPRKAARRLRPAEIGRLREAIRTVLEEAISWGSTVPLNFNKSAAGDDLFYFGRRPEAPGYFHERLLVYDRAGEPCVNCATPIRRLTQGARSTYFCPRCQR